MRPLKDFSLRGFSGYRVEDLTPERLKGLLPGPQGEAPQEGKLFLERHGRRHFQIAGIPKIHLKVYPPDQKKAQQVWKRSLALEEKGLPSPKPLFYGLHQESGWGVFGSQWIPQTTSWIRHLHSLEGLSRENFLTGLACFVVSLHNAGVYQRDLSHWNILVNPEGQFWLVDLDDLSLLSNLSTGKRLRNLIQIFCSALDECSFAERKSLFFQCHSLHSFVGPSLCFSLIEWFAKRRRKAIQKKYRKKYKKEYSVLE